jgi:site-specific DNA recombinase
VNKYNNLGRNNGKPRIAFYTRISTDEDHQKYSLGAQKERLEAFCKAQYGDDWELFKLYRDTESGTHMNRPGLEEMLYDAEAKAFDILLVFRVDRLSRKVRELAQMVDELTKYDIALKSITEPFDTTSAAGKMMLQMLGVFAEFEHTTIVERTKVGLERKARTGRFVGGYVPYGYSLDPEKGLVINEEEAILVKKIFKMYAFGKEGTGAITNKLNGAGYRKRSGKKWDRRILLHILRNPVYLGKLKWNEVLYEGTHEPIISEILFDKVREILAKRNEELKGRQFHNGDERLLSGIMRCAKCGSHMFGSSCYKNGKKMLYYVCSKRHTQHECNQDYVRADLLEESIMEDVRSLFQDEQFMARIWEEANKRLEAEKPDIEKEIRKIEDRILKTREKVDRYFESFETGKMKPEVCNEKVEELNANLRELETEKKELEARRKRFELPPLDKKMLREIVSKLDEVMASGTNPQKKHLLQLLVKKVLIHDRQTIEVWYCLPNAPSKSCRSQDCKPNRQRFEYCHIWLPMCNPYHNRSPFGCQAVSLRNSTSYQRADRFRQGGNGVKIHFLVPVIHPELNVVSCVANMLFFQPVHKPVSH